MNIVVDGRYQIIKRLGKGGFAHTYLESDCAWETTMRDQATATQSRTSEDVAVI
jgi:hypothetical protein